MIDPLVSPNYKAELARLTSAGVASAPVPDEGEHEVTFTVKVKGYGHRVQVTREVQETLERILRLAFHSGYSQAVTEVS